MGYSNFKRLRQVLQKFALQDVREALFTEIKPIEPSVWLKQALQIAEIVPLTNEKAKSEWLIAPILTEVLMAHRETVSLYSGEEINVDAAKILVGGHLMVEFVKEQEFSEVSKSLKSRDSGFGTT